MTQKNPSKLIKIIDRGTKHFSKEDIQLGSGCIKRSLVIREEQFSSVRSLTHIQLFVTPRTTAHQASMSIINSRSPPKPMSAESVMPSKHLILCRPLLLLPSIFPSIRVFSNESVFASGGQSIQALASASVPPMNV